VSTPRSSFYSQNGYTYASCFRGEPHSKLLLYKSFLVRAVDMSQLCLKIRKARLMLICAAPSVPKVPTTRHLFALLKWVSGYDMLGLRVLLHQMIAGSTPCCLCSQYFGDHDSKLRFPVLRNAARCSVLCKRIVEKVKKFCPTGFVMTRSVKGVDSG
jgi:hypothetical protein